MSNRILPFLFLLIPGSLLSQNIRGVVLDKHTKNPVPNCIVIPKGKAISVLTDEHGRFNFQNLTRDKNTTLVFSMLGYSTIEYKLPEYSKDTFYISPKKFELKEIVISANKESILNPKSDESILDFDMLNGNLIILSAGMDFNRLKLLNPYGDQLAQLQVNKRTEKLKYDCTNNLQLYSPDSVWQIFYDFEKLNLLKPYSLLAFENVLGSCVCCHNNTYYFQRSTYRNLRTEYIYYKENEKGIPYKLAKFEDTAKIRDFEMDYSLNYFLNVRRASRYTMYNQPVDTIRKYMERYREELPLDWAYNKWLGSVETEMLTTDNKLYLINYTDSCIYNVNSKIELTFQAKFPVLRNTDLCHKVYIDNDQQQSYLLQFNEKKLVLIKFDIASGKELSRTSIPNVPYLPKKLIVQDNTAYFIKKNLADDQVYKIIKYYLD